MVANESNRGMGIIEAVRVSTGLTAIIAGDPVKACVCPKALYERSGPFWASLNSVKLELVSKLYT